MKTNAQCFESLMSREKSHKAVKKKKIRITASVLSVSVCLVIMLSFLPIFSQYIDNSVTGADAGEPGHETRAENIGPGHEEEPRDTKILPDSVIPEDGNDPMKEPEEERVYDGDKIVINPALPGSDSINPQKVPDGCYTEKWNYDKLCDYFGYEIKLSDIPDGYISDNGDYSFDVQMRDGKPFYPSVWLQYIREYDEASRVCILLSKHDPAGMLGDLYIKIDGIGKNSIIDGTDVLICADEARTVYMASFCDDGIYRLLFGFEITEHDFIGFVKSAVSGGIN